MGGCVGVWVVEMGGCVAEMGGWVEWGSVLRLIDNFNCICRQSMPYG